MCMYLCTCIYVCMCVCASSGIYVCEFMPVCVCVHVSIYVQVCACVCVCTQRCLRKPSESLSFLCFCTATTPTGDGSHQSGDAAPHIASRSLERENRVVRAETQGDPVLCGLRSVPAQQLKHWSPGLCYPSAVAFKDAARAPVALLDSQVSTPSKSLLGVFARWKRPLCASRTQLQGRE